MDIVASSDACFLWVEVLSHVVVFKLILVLEL
jgi:hypothetical protein